MAVTIGSGLVRTPRARSRTTSASPWTSQVANAQDVDNTQFTTMLMKLPSSTAKSFKEEWMEDQFLPTNTALSATAASADTNLAVTTSEGNYFKVGDVIRFVQTGEPFRVTTVGASASRSSARSTVRPPRLPRRVRTGHRQGRPGSNEQGGTLPTAMVTRRPRTTTTSGIAA
jgi:hypothetical protein